MAVELRSGCCALRVRLRAQADDAHRAVGGADGARTNVVREVEAVVVVCRFHDPLPRVTHARTPLYRTTSIAHGGTKPPLRPLGVAQAVAHGRHRHREVEWVAGVLDERGNVGVPVAGVELKDVALLNGDNLAVAGARVAARRPVSAVPGDAFTVNHVVGRVVIPAAHPLRPIADVARHAALALARLACLDLHRLSPC